MDAIAVFPIGVASMTAKTATLAAITPSFRPRLIRTPRGRCTFLSWVVTRMSCTTVGVDSDSTFSTFAGWLKLTDSSVRTSEF
ncbi:hypothetical protein D3C78_1367910 [compost metagenome]